MITAMSAITTILLLALLALGARLLVGYVRHDGFARPRPDRPGATAAKNRLDFDPWRDAWAAPPRIRLH